MRYVGILFCLVGFAAQAADLEFAADRMAVINGERTFILGLYETFAEPDMYQTVADAGFNIVHGGAQKEALDRLAEVGLFAWVQTNDWIDLGSDRANRETQLRTLVDQFRDHPALLVWEVPDEMLWHAWNEPAQWRIEDEPKELSALLSDRSSKKKGESDLMAELHRVRALYAEGRYEDGERGADAIWKALGKEQPHPELSIANAKGRAEKKREGVLAGYRFLKSIDDGNAVWMNHAPRNQIATLAAFNEAADIVGCDIYPAPSGAFTHSDIADQTLSAVGAYTERMRAASPNKPVWMVLQGFGWIDLLKDLGPVSETQHRRPTAHEMRFMAYDAVVHGARGILYWGTHVLEKDSVMWNDLLALTREMANLQPVLSAPALRSPITVTSGETWGSADRAIEALAKDVDGQLALVVVNEWSERLEYTIGGLEAFEGEVLRDGVGNVEVSVVDGAVVSRLAPYGVHVLRQVSQ